MRCFGCSIKWFFSNNIQITICYYFYWPITRPYSLISLSDTVPDVPFCSGKYTDPTQAFTICGLLSCLTKLSYFPVPSIHYLSSSMSFLNMLVVLQFTQLSDCKFDCFTILLLSSDTAYKVQGCFIVSSMY